jgi:hypothetical protein
LNGNLPLNSIGSRTSFGRGAGRYRPAIATSYSCLSSIRSERSTDRDQGSTAMKTIVIGVMSQEQIRARTIAIAKGE